jgi:hypothetical protein
MTLRLLRAEIGCLYTPKTKQELVKNRFMTTNSTSVNRESNKNPKGKTAMMSVSNARFYEIVFVYF